MDFPHKSKLGTWKNYENEVLADIDRKANTRKKKSKETNQGGGIRKHSPEVKKKFLKKKHKSSSKVKSIERNLSLVGSALNSKEKYLKRPKSVIHKSMPSQLEFSQKVQQPLSTIEKLINNTLKSAKYKKAKEAKVNKLTEIINQIKKSETDYHNRQVRLHNSLKLKKKAKKSSPNPDNIQNLRTDTSNKIRENELNYSDPLKLNQRSSSEANNHSKNYCSSVTPNGFIKKSRKTRQNTKKKGKGIREAPGFDLNFDKESIDIVSDSSSFDRVDILNHVNRNISFFDEKNSENLNLKAENDEKFSIFDPHSEITETFHDEKLYRMPNFSLPEEYFQFSASYDKRIAATEGFTIDSTGFMNVFPVKPELTLQVYKQNKKLPTKTPQVLTINTEKVVFSANSLKKPENGINSTTGVSVFPVKKNLQLEKTCSILCETIKKSEFSLLEESISLNYAQIYMIEQLKKHEISNILGLGLSDFKTQRAELEIDKKYSNLLQTLNDLAKKCSGELLENFSISEHQKFIQNMQGKKQFLHEVLLESTEIPPENSEESSEDSEEFQKIGISHSRSLNQLHGDEAVKGKPRDISEFIVKDAENNLFFGFSEGLERDEPVESTVKPVFLCPNLSFDEKKPISTGKICEISDFISEILNSIDPEFLLTELSKPLFKDPFKELEKIGEIQIGELTETEIREFPVVILNFPQLETDSETVKTFKKMLFDVLNYLLQQFRPFGYKGSPFPWDRSAVFPLNRLSFNEICIKVLEDFEDLNDFGLGNLNMLLINSERIDENLFVYAKERQIEKVIMKEAVLDDDKWINYAFEETQVKLDMADMVLYELVEEIIKIL